MKGIIYKFNHASNYTLEDLKRSPAYKLMEKLDRGEKPTEKEMRGEFSALWHSESYKSGIVHYMGWTLDFTPYFKRYLANVKYYGWLEYRAYNRTMLRKLATTPSHILEIVEINTRNRDKAA